MKLSHHSLPVFSRLDKDMPGVRAEDGSDARVGPDDVLGQELLPSEDGGDSDATETREALDTEAEESSFGCHSPFPQVHDEKVPAAFLKRDKQQRCTATPSTCTVPYSVSSCKPTDSKRE